MKLSLFTSGNDLLEAAKRASFDLYLLDVILQGEDGIALARALRAREDKGCIVFFTSSPDFALPAFSVKAFDYLLKPVSQEALSSVLGELEARLSARPQRQISFRTPGGLRTVQVSELMYVEVMGHIPYYHLREEVVRGSELRIPFEQVAEGLIELGCFLRPHRSYLVNAAHIATFSGKGLWLDDGTPIPLARMRASETKVQYLDYLENEGRYG